MIPLQSTISPEDFQFDYSELFSIISEIILKAQFASILHLTPLVDAINELTVSHRERKTSFNLICLLSFLVSQLKMDKFILTEDNDQYRKGQHFGQLTFYDQFSLQNWEILIFVLKMGLQPK